MFSFPSVLLHETSIKTTYSSGVGAITGIPADDDSEDFSLSPLYSCSCSRNNFERCLRSCGTQWRRRTGLSHLPVCYPRFYRPRFVHFTLFSGGFPLSTKPVCAVSQPICRTDLHRSVASFPLLIFVCGGYFPILVFMSRDMSHALLCPDFSARACGLRDPI